LLRVPEALTAKHDLSNFQCRQYPDLAEWLQRRAPRNEGKASRTYVQTLGDRVIGYYCLSTGSIERAIVNAKTRQNMPEPIPVLVIGRLAVDDEFAGKGLGYGKGLLQDALKRCLVASKAVGVRAVVVHAKDDKSAGFYKKYKFIESQTDPLTFFLPMETIEQVFKNPQDAPA
jgi:hypothetical protein